MISDNVYWSALSEFDELFEHVGLRKLPLLSETSQEGTHL